MTIISISNDHSLFLLHTNEENRRREAETLIIYYPWKEFYEEFMQLNYVNVKYDELRSLFFDNYII